VPIPAGRKGPRVKDWPNFTFKPGDEWNEPGIGIILGERSGGLVDVDLDAKEAVIASPSILPETRFTFGRKSKGRSHYLYRVSDLAGKSPCRINDPESGESVVELRFSHTQNDKFQAMQTVFPPTLHPEGERITWADHNVLRDENPPELKFDILLQAFKELAAVSILAKRWDEGRRHQISLAWGGFLARVSVDRSKAAKLTEAVCLAAGDPEVDDRLRAVNDTHDKIEENEPATGTKRLSELIGDKVVRELRKLLGVASYEGSTKYVQEMKEEPRPLTREIPPSEPYPVQHLGDHLSDTVSAIEKIVQVPTALAAGSVLATASLATQGFANVILPIGNGTERPLSLFFVTVAQSSDRKTTADDFALRPVREREKELGLEYREAMKVYNNRNEAYQKLKNETLKNKKTYSNLSPSDALDEYTADLAQLGDPPERPLLPYLTVQEPTFEGLIKLFQNGHPSIGLFSAEGGQMIAGHGMRDERKIFTASGLCSLWDGQELKRIRVLDGIYNLPGRRLALHLMIQPRIAAMLFNDRELEDIGFLSRILVAAPESLAGTRIYTEAPPWANSTLDTFKQVILEILRRPCLTAEGCKNILQPRPLPFSSEAKAIWVEFHNEVEKNIGPGGKFEQIKGFSGKLPEQAARIAGILTLIDNLNAREIPVNFMESACHIARYYANETLRIFQIGTTSSELMEAQKLLDWLHKSWEDSMISLPDIYQRGPNSVRDKSTAKHLVKILADHGWLEEIPGGAKIQGRFRSEVWRIAR